MPANEDVLPSELETPVHAGTPQAELEAPYQSRAAVMPRLCTPPLDAA